MEDNNNNYNSNNNSNNENNMNSENNANKGGSGNTIPNLDDMGTNKKVDYRKMPIDELPADKKQQLTYLCHSSMATLAAAVLFVIISIALTGMAQNGSIFAVSHATANGISDVLISIVPVLHLVSLVLMIVIRCMYPKSTYGKVLMWLHIVVAIIVIITIIVLIAVFIACVNSCIDIADAFGSLA